MSGFGIPKYLNKPVLILDLTGNCESLCIQTALTQSELTSESLPLNYYNLTLLRERETREKGIDSINSD